jgi:hypothetical protein
MQIKQDLKDLSGMSPEDAATILYHCKTQIQIKGADQSKSVFERILSIPTVPTHALHKRDNWDGEGDHVFLFAFEQDGVLYNFENGKPVLEYQGDKVLNAWVLGSEPEDRKAQAHFMPLDQPVGIADRVLNIPNTPTHALLKRDNWEGKGKSVFLFAFEQGGVLYNFEDGQPVLECQGDKIMKAWEIGANIEESSAVPKKKISKKFGERLSILLSIIF